MSLYKPAKSRYFHYDFVQKGRRFHGSTGVQTRRKAEEVERKLRNDAALGLLDDGGAMTLGQAVERWWVEVGEELNTAVDCQRIIYVLLELFGEHTPLVDITQAKIAQAIQRRRQMAFQKAKGANAKKYLPSNATVNLEMIDRVLRPILRKAPYWGVKNLPAIDWKELRLPQPKPKALEFNAAELAAIAAACRSTWAPFIDFMSRYGLRLDEMFFPLAALDIEDPQSARLTIRDRKGGDDKVLPLLAKDAQMFVERVRRAKAAGLDTVWYRAEKQRKPTDAPKLVAYTPAGAGIALRRAMTRTGLRAAKGARGAHGLRHHAAMKALRATGNIRTVQRLLGHADIRSTLVYADAVEDDVKGALAAVSRNSPAPATKAKLKIK
jgi:integrase